MNKLNIADVSCDWGWPVVCVVILVISFSVSRTAYSEAQRCLQYCATLHRFYLTYYVNIQHNI